MNAQVWIILGSASDAGLAEEVTKGLQEIGVTYEVFVASAHRSPDKVMSLASRAATQDVQVIIAIAGKAAALPGLVAALTPLPVIGVPVISSEMAGLDALCSMTQLPKGTPVATMGLGKAGAANAALLAGRIVALAHPEVRQKLIDVSTRAASSIVDAEAEVRKRLSP